MCGSFGRVLSVKSGFAVSSLDDALFSPSVDEALQFSNATLKEAEGRVLFSTLLQIDNPAANSFTARVVKDWYKSRWVPCWRAPDRARSPHAPTGWLSWNTYFDTAGSKENLDEARFAAKWFKPFGMEVWNIESWQDDSSSLPVSKFHNMNLETYAVQFPEGMKWLADEIRRLGFKPGLWMAPFGTGNEAFYAEHKDWFLHRADGDEPPKGSDSPFVDVESWTYYAESVQWAVEQKITDGVDPTHFSPDTICTRAQIGTFLQRFMTRAGA